jgi:hypothetical protein
LEAGLSTEWVNKKTGKKWTGCVTDRNQPYNVQDTAPTGADQSYPAIACVNPAPLLALTDNWDGLPSSSVTSTVCSIFSSPRAHPASTRHGLLRSSV